MQASDPGRRDGLLRPRPALAGPSSLYARAEKKGGKVVAAKIAGETVLVADGMIEVD